MSSNNAKTKITKTDPTLPDVNTVSSTLTVGLQLRAFPALFFSLSPSFSVFIPNLIIPSSLSIGPRFVCASLRFFHVFSLGSEKSINFGVEDRSASKSRKMVSPKQFLSIVEESLLGPNPPTPAQRIELIHAIRQSLPSLRSLLSYPVSKH